MENDRSGILTSPFSRLAKLRRVLRRGENALHNGDLESAEPAGRRVLEQLGIDPIDPTSLRRGEPCAMIAGLELFARVRRELTDFVGCVQLHQQALAALEMVPAGANRDRLRLAALIRLGEALRLLGQFPEAEDALMRAMQLADTPDPPDPINRAMTLNGLGIVFKDTQRFEQAGQCYRHALTLLVQTFGPNDLELAPLYHNLAGLEHAQDRFTEGEPLARRALELRATHEGLETTGAAADLAVLGALLLGQQRYTEAERAFARSLAIWQGRYGQHHYEVAVVKHNLAALYQTRGDQPRALRTLSQVLDIKWHILGLLTRMSSHSANTSHDLPKNPTTRQTVSDASTTSDAAAACPRCTAGETVGWPEIRERSAEWERSARHPEAEGSFCGRKVMA
jgi:tetratricopeptide (TPR) repeat protein